MNTEDLLRAPIIPKRVFTLDIGATSSTRVDSITVNDVDLSSDDELNELEDSYDLDNLEPDFLAFEISHCDNISSAQNIMTLKQRHFFYMR